MASILRITMDTNSVISLLDWSSPFATSVDEVAGLFAYAMEGKVEIAITTRGESDLSNDRVETRRQAILRRLATFPVIGSIGRWDVSSWDGDQWPDERAARAAEEIQQLLFPGLSGDHPRYSNMINDVDHLVGHMIDRRDIFVTDDTRILKRREQLQRSPGLIVMTPAECLAHIDGIAARARPRTLPSEMLNPDYHARELRGSVTFDYSNNNHSFAIGEGEALFETKWSKASNVAIHAYRDGASIDALALAKGASKIVEIADATAYDFSSRVRTVGIGQIAIWRNVNGLFAATKVIAIKDESRGDSHDELTFEYVILPDGTTAFGASAFRS